MKIRNGFVSNSSSSSFIVGVNDDYKNATVTIVLKKKLIDLASNIIKNKEDLLSYFKDNYYENDEVYVARMLKELETYGTLMVIETSDEDSDIVSNILYNSIDYNYNVDDSIQFSSNVKIIKEYYGE